MNNTLTNNLFVVILLLTSSGCLSSSRSSTEKVEHTTSWAEDELSGFYENPSSSANDNLIAMLGIVLDHSNITQIIIEFAIEDGDSNTNDDELIEVKIQNKDYELFLLCEALYTERSTMPCNGQISMNGPDSNLTESQFLDRQLDLIVTWSQKDSDDQWPGPLIWRGVRDTGFSYDFQIRYEYVVNE